MAELRTPEEKKLIVENCIDIEMAGGSVLDYLAAEGYVTPRATWVNIQKKYLGRSDAQHSITEGKATGKKRKGKRPGIRKDALEQDLCEWEISKERAEEERRKDPETSAVGRSALIIEKSGIELPGMTITPDRIVTQTKEPELVVTGIWSGTGQWNSINREAEDPLLQFIVSGGVDSDQNAIVLRRSEWRAVIREFPAVCRMMGIGDGGCG